MFERTLKDEESERRKMKQRLQEERKKRQQEMYQDSIRILKELETDLLSKNILSEEREKVVEAREMKSIWQKKAGK